MNRRAWTLVLAACVAGLTAPTTARTDFCEGPVDAGSLPETARRAEGVGSLSNIIGRLEGPGAAAGVGDFEDMYLIRISTPVQFEALTFGKGSAEFDTLLWIFEGPGADIGLGQLGNDDDPVGPPGDQGNSRLLNASTDGTPIVLDPGDYYIAISVRFPGGARRVPISNTGEIFDIQVQTEISGPDGPGGNQRVVDWIPEPPDVIPGDYVIHFEAVKFPPPAEIPTVTEWGMIVMGLLLLAAATWLIRRRGTVPATI